MKNLELLHLLFKKNFESSFFSEEKQTGYYRCPNSDCDTNNKLKKSYGKNKLSIAYDKNIFHCWVCNYSGTLNKIVNEYFSNEDKNEFKELNKNNKSATYHEKIENANNSYKELQITNKFLPLIKKTNNREDDRKSIIYYLTKDRGINPEIIMLYNLMFYPYDKYKNHLIVPSYDKNRKINYFVGRTILIKYNKPYINPNIKSSEIIFNEYLIDFKKELILVEGVFDYLKLHGLNRACILGSYFGKKSLLFQKIIENKTPVKILLDADANDKALKIENLLLKWNIKCCIIDNILNEHNLKDPGEIDLKNKSEIFDKLKKDFASKSKIDLLKTKFKNIS
jgi:hypothetical protein